MKFGIICEGVTDFHVLKHVIQAYFKEEADCRPIQPNLDETHNKTAKGSFGNWLQVAAYLKSDHLEQTLVDMNYVVVQIDTDVCELTHFDVSPITLADTDHQAFYEQIKLKLIEWMDSYEANTYDYYKDKIIFAISVHSLECWLLAYYDTKTRSCKIKGCESALSRVLNSKGKSISKNAQEYIEHSKDFKNSKNHAQIIVKSESFRVFVQQLTDITNRGKYRLVDICELYRTVPFTKNLII